MIDFPILNRWSGAVQFTATIDCDPNDPTALKIGLAVKWAILNRASLVGASLVGASLDRASLDGASLVGASLDRASLDGASLVGASLDGASLDRASLVGASLVGASLDGASLDRASLDRASLVGASLVGALIAGKKIVRLVAIVSRINDPYVFHAFETEGGEVWIKAGCRFFTPDQYRAHVEEKYPDTDKASETRDILDFIEQRAHALGIRGPK